MMLCLVILFAAPASIRPGPQRVIAQLNFPTYLQCDATGYPEPNVSWWRGVTMLPFNSLKYLKFVNHTLMIRRVESRDEGTYRCQAYNQIGPIVTWDVELLIDFSVEPIIPFEPSEIPQISHSAEPPYVGGGFSPEIPHSSSHGMHV